MFNVTYGVASIKGVITWAGRRLVMANSSTNYNELIKDIACVRLMRASKWRKFKVSCLEGKRQGYYGVFNISIIPFLEGLAALMAVNTQDCAHNLRTSSIASIEADGKNRWVVKTHSGSIYTLEKKLLF